LKAWALQGAEVSEFMRRNVVIAPLLFCIEVRQYHVTLPTVAGRAPAS
jgi:hypothetical protein